MNKIAKSKSLLVEKNISVEKVLRGEKSYFDVEDKSEGSIKKYQNILEGMSCDQRLNFVISSLGYNPNSLTIYSKMALLTQLVPLVCKNYNMMLLGAAAVGKSSLYNLFTENVLIHSGMPSTAALRGNIKEDSSKAILEEHIVCIEEVADESGQIKEQLSILKQAMESHCFLYKNEENKQTQTSIVFIANNYYETKYFEDLKNFKIFSTIPKSLQDEAFLDRFSSTIYKDVKFKLSHSNLIHSPIQALNVNFLFNTFFLLRENSDFFNYIATLDDIRDSKRVSLTLQGYLKILYPGRDVPTYIIEGLTAFATHFRYIGRKEYTPFRSSSIKLIIDTLERKDNIEKIYLTENRILVKYINENHYHKIALNPWGIDENLKEIKYVVANNNEKIAKIDVGISNEYIIIQDFYPLAHETCCYDRHGNMLNNLETEKEDFEYNKAFISLIKRHAIEGLPPPDGDLREWRLIPEGTIREQINTLFGIKRDYIPKSVYFYAENKLKVLNFALFLE